MNPESMAEALSAIHDEALKLLKLTLPEEAREGVHLIISLARYRTDVRTATEQEG
jgi:hypothetical protein